MPPASLATGERGRLPRAHPRQGRSPAGPVPGPRTPLRGTSARASRRSEGTHCPLDPHRLLARRSSAVPWRGWGRARGRSQVALLQPGLLGFPLGHHDFEVLCESLCRSGTSGTWSGVCAVCWVEWWSWGSTRFWCWGRAQGPACVASAVPRGIPAPGFCCSCPSVPRPGNGEGHSAHSWARAEASAETWQLWVSSCHLSPTCPCV